MKKFLYFAYGSNLNITQMKQRCPDSAGVSTAVLDGYQVVERTYADIGPGECVNGALYEISENDLAELDLYEGYPEYYTRQEVMVSDNSGTYRKALVYIMTEEWGIPNAFARHEELPSTLWENGIPDTANGLVQMLHYLDSGKVVPQAKRLWIGARVIITLKPQNIKGGDFDFYPAPLEVTTPYGQELSWVFYDLQKIFKKHLNSINKFDFYGKLAECAAEVAQKTEISGRELCLQVVLKAKEIYNGME